jgi:hypothetical protein
VVAILPLFYFPYYICPLDSKESTLGFDCVKFGKVKKDTEFIAILVNDCITNVAHIISTHDETVEMQAFFKIRNPVDDSYNVVSLATGVQYFVGKNVEVFVYNE